MHFTLTPRKNKESNNFVKAVQPYFNCKRPIYGQYFVIQKYSIQILVPNSSVFVIVKFKISVILLVNNKLQFDININIVVSLIIIKNSNSGKIICKIPISFCNLQYPSIQFN